MDRRRLFPRFCLERDKVLYLMIDSAADCNFFLLHVFVQIFMPDCLEDKPYVSHE